MDEKEDIDYNLRDKLAIETGRADMRQSDALTDDPASTLAENTTTVPDDANLTQNSSEAGWKEPTVPGWRLAILIVSISIGLFLSLLDTSIIATALYTIGDDFQDLSRVNWVALAYTLSYIGFAVIFASLADVFGRRNMFLLATVIFIAFSLGCGFANSLDQLIALRTVQGLGGAGLYALTMIIFTEVCPRSLLKWIGGAIGAVIAVAGVMGPVLGGIITHYTTWRWIFWINGPIGMISIVLFWLFWPPADQMLPYDAKPLKHVDFFGSALLTAASVLVVFAFQEGGLGANRWETAIFLVPIIVGSVCWIVLFGWEAMVEQRWPNLISSIFPLRLLRNRVYTSAMIATLLTGYPYFTVIYDLPIRFQVVHGKGVLVAGLYLLPMLASSAVGSMLGGAFSSTRNNTFYVLLISSTFVLLGTALLSTLSDTLPLPAKTFGFEIFVGLGFGLTVSTVSLLGNLESPLQDRAVAQGILAQMRVLGGSIGIAASTAILGVNQRKQLSGIVTADQLASLQSIGPSLSPLQWAAIRKAYSDAFSESLQVCAAVAGVCMIVTLGTFRRKRELVKDIQERQFMEEQKRLRARAQASEIGRDAV